MALIRPDDVADVPSWRELWAVEMRGRRWLWIGNLFLACAVAGQLLGGL